MAGSASFLARRRCPRGHAPTSPTERQLTDHTTADAIDRAVRLERWVHAGRLVRAAAEIEPKSPRLVERLVRVRLAQGEPDAALDVIDRAGLGTPLPAPLRLLRAACLIHRGERELAAHDLRCWLKEKAPPLEAGVVLALLDWHRGDEHAATLTLLRNVRWLEHPASLDLLLLIAIHGGRHEQAEVWTRRLANANRRAFGTALAGVMAMLFDAPPPTADTPVPTEHLETLAHELRAEENVIPALVEALRRRPEPETADLLAAAIERTLDDLRHPDAARAALATLAAISAGPAADVLATIGPPPEEAPEEAPEQAQEQAQEQAA